MDLNRNHLILTEPETIALHKLFDEYLFEVSMDVHEYAPYGETWKNYGYRFNNDEEIDGLTVQLPLPSHIDIYKIICSISPKKDIEGFLGLTIPII